MPRKATPLPSPYKLYAIPVQGNAVTIAAREIKAECGKRKVSDPGVVANATSGVGYVFTPVKFMESCWLYDHAILMETDMPADMLPYYLQYETNCAIERVSRPKQQ